LIRTLNLLKPDAFRVLVTGSRDWLDEAAVRGALDSYLFTDLCYDGPRSVVIVNGLCPKGADWYALNWQQERYDQGYNAVTEPHPADWERYGKQAGFKRNAEMVGSGADICLAFIRAQSKGASHTLALAREAGIRCRVWREALLGDYLGEDEAA
jgi:hypothetical protein